MCTPTIFFVMLTGMIGIFQIFTVRLADDRGRPAHRDPVLRRSTSTATPSRFFKMGYASALAWILFLIPVAVTIALFRSSARWVYYGGQTDEGKGRPIER